MPPTLSVIIPNYKDPYLIQTIDSLLARSGIGDDIEIIAVLDSYWPKFELREDKRVRYLHMGKNQRNRKAVNAGIRLARGKYIMRTDSHCSFGQDYAKEMIKTCEENWVMTPRRYYLNPLTWEFVDDRGYVDYERLMVRDTGDGVMKFEGVIWHERKRERADIMIDENMAIQGSVWFMHKSLWDKLGELDYENYGDHYQDSHEIVFKVWKMGGKLMVNKNVWFAHKDVRYPRTWSLSKDDWAKGVKYSYETWKDYYEEIKTKWGI